MDEYPEVRKIADANAGEHPGFAGESRVVLRHLPRVARLRSGFGSGLCAFQ